MRKKVLFIIGVIDSGGVAKSLVNTLTTIDKNRYEVHLLIMSNNNGTYEEFLPNNIIIHRNKIIGLLLNKWRGVAELFKRFHIFLAVGSIIRMVVSKFDKGLSGWILSRLYPPLNMEFDTIIDYNGQQNLYYMVDKLKATKKVTFFHSDYNKWSYYKKYDAKYFPKVNAIFSVSKECVASLQENFTNVASKIFLFENISSPSIIKSLSEKSIDFEKHTTTLITIGHISRMKGTDLALDAAKILKQRGYKFKWLFIGNITEPEFKNLISKYNLETEVDFLGIKSNPYPYIKIADIFVHPSRFEGKSIALDEAKILCKPIVVTNFSTVHDQFTDGVNATICQINSEDIANSIETLINNKSVCNKYIKNLEDNIVDNTNQIEKLYRLFEQN